MTPCHPSLSHSKRTEQNGESGVVGSVFVSLTTVMATSATFAMLSAMPDAAVSLRKIIKFRTKTCNESQTNKGVTNVSNSLH